MDFLKKWIFVILMSTAIFTHESGRADGQKMLLCSLFVKSASATGNEGERYDVDMDDQPYALQFTSANEPQWEVFPQVSETKSTLIRHKAFWARLIRDEETQQPTLQLMVLREYNHKHHNQFSFVGRKGKYIPMHTVQGHASGRVVLTTGLEDQGRQLEFSCRPARSSRDI